MLEISRRRARKHALDRFKYVRTCVSAWELCLLVGINRVVLDKEDIRDCCSFISKLCNETGCDEASGLYAKAAEAVIGSEETYLKLCEQSCKKCSKSKRPRRLRPERAVYVA